MPMTAINLTGERFGHLTVLHRVAIVAKSAVWLCRCTCGATKQVTATRLRDGRARSCGCGGRAGKAENHANPFG